MEIGKKAAQFDFWEYIIRIFFAVRSSVFDRKVELALLACRCRIPLCNCRSIQAKIIMTLSASRVHRRKMCFIPTTCCCIFLGCGALACFMQLLVVRSWFLLSSAAVCGSCLFLVCLMSVVEC